MDTVADVEESGHEVMVSERKVQQALNINARESP